MGAAALSLARAAPAASCCSDRIGLRPRGHRSVRRRRRCQFIPKWYPPVLTSIPMLGDSAGDRIDCQYRKCSYLFALEADVHLSGERVCKPLGVRPSGSAGTTCGPSPGMSSRCLGRDVPWHRRIGRPPAWSWAMSTARRLGVSARTGGGHRIGRSGSGWCPTSQARSRAAVIDAAGWQAPSASWRASTSRSSDPAANGRHALAMSADTVRDRLRCLCTSTEGLGF
jgi:hypothetical protein